MNEEHIKNAINFLKYNKTIFSGNTFLVFNKQEWLINPIIKWTEEEIDNADENGLIGTKCGVDCYLTRQVKTI